MLEALVAGFASILSIKVLLMIFVGMLLGVTFGFLPGLGGTITLAILIPFTFGMDTNVAFAFLLGAHASVVVAGSVTAILFRVPGTGQNVATCFDGYPMSQKGEAGRAIGIASMSSMMGGIFGALILGLSLPIIRPVIMAFGPAEFFMLTLLGLSIISLLTAGSLIKGLAAGGLGLLLSFVGMDYITGTARYTFGQLVLWDGIDFVAVVIGLFAIAQMVELYVQGGSIAQRDVPKTQSSVFRGIKDVFERWSLLIRCSALGSIIGMIPGVGGTIANILAYGHALQTAKDPENFGKGHPDGIIGPEASNNAKEGGSLIPTVAFGIPGSEAMAILLGGFLMMGLVPGPEMITKHADVVYMLVAIIVIANIMASGMALLFANKLQRLTKLPGNQLIPVVMVICLVGAYAINQRWMDVMIALAFGIVGYFMKRLNYSRAAFIIAMVLGTFVERYYHVSVRLFGQFFFVKRPVALGLLFLVIFSLLLPFIQSKYKKSGGVSS